MVEDLAEVEWDRKNEREYVATWRVEEVSLLEVTVTYHGKKPNLPFKGPKPSFDWQTRDADFYSCIIRNHSDQPIHLRTVSLELEKGTPKDDSAQGDSYLMERWGSTTIPPGRSLSRRNTWVWGRGSENTLTKTYLAEMVPGAGGLRLTPPSQLSSSSMAKSRSLSPFKSRSSTDDSTKPRIFGKDKNSPFQPPSGPAQRLFQEPPAESKLLAMNYQKSTA
jgi:hypothetical protein